MKLKTVLVASGSVAFGASAGVAQSADVDWTGFYAGVGVMTGDGQSDPIPGPLFPLEDGSAGLEVFAGYDHVFANNFVLGGEIGYSNAEFNGPFAGALNSYSDVFDLKVRLGYATGRWLPYLVVGGSRVDGLGFGGRTYTSDGYSYGLGVNYAVNEQMFIGAELLDRRLNGNGSGGGKKGKAANTDLDIRTIAVRIGWRF